MPMNETMTMTRGRVLHLRNYVTTLAILFAAVGLLFGVIGLAGSFLGMHVFFALGPFYIQGIPAGVLGVALMPVVAAITGAILGLISYLPVSWVYRHT